jgi:hypothetical protein
MKKLADLIQSLRDIGLSKTAENVEVINNQINKYSASKFDQEILVLSNIKKIVDFFEGKDLDEIAPQGLYFPKYTLETHNRVIVNEGADLSFYTKQEIYNGCHNYLSGFINNYMKNKALQLYGKTRGEYEDVIEQLKPIVTELNKFQQVPFYRATKTEVLSHTRAVQTHIARLRRFEEVVKGKATVGAPIQETYLGLAGLYSGIVDRQGTFVETSPDLRLREKIRQKLNLKTTKPKSYDQEEEEDVYEEDLDESEEGILNIIKKNQPEPETEIEDTTLSPPTPSAPSQTHLMRLLQSEDDDLDDDDNDPESELEKTAEAGPALQKVLTEKQTEEDQHKQQVMEEWDKRHFEEIRGINAEEEFEIIRENIDSDFAESLGMSLEGFRSKYKIDSYVRASSKGKIIKTAEDRELYKQVMKKQKQEKLDIMLDGATFAKAILGKKWTKKTTNQYGLTRIEMLSPKDVYIGWLYLSNELEREYIALVKSIVSKSTEQTKTGRGTEGEISRRLEGLIGILRKI